MPRAEEKAEKPVRVQAVAADGKSVGTTLARQNEELKRELARRDEELAHQTAKLAELEDLAKRLGRDNALLKDKLYRLMSRRYGPKGDRFPEGQLELFEELFGEEQREEPDRQALEAPDTELPDEPEPKKARRQKNRAREVDFRSLPRERRMHELSEEQRICPVTGKLLVPVGTKTFEELCYQPAKLFVVEHELVEYGLSEEERAERTAPSVVAPMPLRPITKGLPSAGLLARILVAKYVEHLPLHRQETIFAREGLLIPRQSLCEWVMRSIEILLPIVLALKRRLLAGAMLQCDDTKVLCQENSVRGGRSWAFLWAWVGEDPEEVVYDFSMGRDHGVVEAWIGNEWSGYLVGDGYAGFGTVCRKRDAEHPIVEVGCWAHARRKVREAATNAPEDAIEVAGWIRELYRIEKEAREAELDADALRELRRRKGLPVLWKMRSLVRVLVPKYGEDEAMGKALRYIENQWRTLRQYVKDGRLPIDNNACERAIRPVAVGRRNWLFAGSPRGGKMGAAIYSIVETCKRAGVNPFEYLEDVLVRVHVTPEERMDDLVPRRWRELRDAGELAELAT